jgi:predicted nuclease with TOPRIM domain
MQKQVEEVQKRAQDNADKLERLRVDNARLQAMYDAENEKVSRLEVSSREVQDLNRQNARYQTELENAGKRLNELEGSFERERSRLREAEHARTEMVEQVLKLQAKVAEGRRRPATWTTVRAQLTKAEELVRDGAKENGALKTRLAEIEAKVQETQGPSTSRRPRRRGSRARTSPSGRRSPICAPGSPRSRPPCRRNGTGPRPARATSRSFAGNSKRRRRESGRSSPRSTAPTAEIKTLEKAENEDRSKKQALQRGGVLAEEAPRRGRVARRGQPGGVWIGSRGEVATLRKSLDEERRKAAAAQDELAAPGSGSTKPRRARRSCRPGPPTPTASAGARPSRSGALPDQEPAVGSWRRCARIRDTAAESLEKAMSDVSALRQELGRRDRDQEAQRDKIVVVTSDLEEIEKKYSDEQQELGGLREKSQALEEALANTQGVLAQTHGEMQSLQEILQREQDANREMQVEYTSAQSKLQEVTSQSARLEEQVKGLLEQNNRLKDRLNKADITTAATQALDHRLATVERLMDQARQQTGDARAAAATRRRRPSRCASRSWSQVNGSSKRKKPGAPRPGRRRPRRPRAPPGILPADPPQGAAAEARADPGEGRPAPSVGSAAGRRLGADRRRPPPRNEKGPKLEILGGTRGPEISDLRQFLDRVPPRASHAVSRVHDALRHNLFSIAERPGRLVLDVGSVDLPETVPSAVAYEPESKEFWHGELRTVSDKDTQGIVPFLKECVSKVPGRVPAEPRPVPAGLRATSARTPSGS